MKKLTVVFYRSSTEERVARALRSLQENAEGGGGGVGEHDVVFVDQMHLGGGNKSLQHHWDACKAVGVAPFCQSTRLYKQEEVWPDLSTEWDGILPGPFSGGYLPRDLSVLVNQAMDAAEGEYVLLMGPAETVTDPENVPRTLAFMDTQPGIGVISCGVKVYEGGEHVRTLMVPKIFRRGAVKSAGVLADSFTPQNENNWLLNASGLSFKDHGDATPRTADVDLKLRLAQVLAYSGKGEDVAPRKLAVEVSRELVRFKPSAAIAMSREILKRYKPGAIETVAPLATLARATEMIGETEESLSLYDASIQLFPTVDALLGRGFLLHREGDLTGGERAGWRKDLQHAVDLVKKTTSYEVDLREVRRAARLLEGAAS